MDYKHMTNNELVRLLISYAYEAGQTHKMYGSLSKERMELFEKVLDIQSELAKREIVEKR